MTHFAPVRAAIALAATSIAALTISSALAQTQPPATQRPATPQRPPAASAPKPAQPAQQQPAQPAQPQAQPDPAQQQAVFPPLMFSQWVKFCVGPDGQPADQKDPQIKTKQICMTGIDGRAESGQPLVGVVAVEPPGDNKKVLRVTFPFGMLLQRGTRVIIDDTQPMQAPFFTCYPGGCYADYELTNDSLTKMKKGKTVYVQAITIQNSPVTVGVPLTEFAKAFDSPPADPKVLEEQQKKLEEDLKRKGEELQKKAKEAREKLESAPKQ
jgi:invasion protein IalB